jgi:hypothetical protein
MKFTSSAFRLSMQAALLLLAFTASDMPAATTFSDEQAAAFTDRYCSNCHNDVDKEGGLDLTALKYAPKDSANFVTWVRIHDRVRSGEMPPKEKKRPAPAEMTAFLGGLAGSLIAEEQKQSVAEGRATQRRLNRYEYENVLRDLLNAPWLQVKDRLPEDGELHGFNRLSGALDVSHVHMARYMGAAEYALRQVLQVQANRTPTSKVRIYAREEPSLAGPTRFRHNLSNNNSPTRRHFPLLGTKPQPDVIDEKAPVTVGADDPVTREQEAVGWVSSNYVIGYASDWRTFTAPVTGRYRLKFSGYTAWVGPGGFRYDLVKETGKEDVGIPQPPKWYHPNYYDVSAGRRHEPMHIYSGGGVARLLGTFDLTPEPGVFELEPQWLHANEWIITDATRFVRTRTTPTYQGVRYINPLAQSDGMPAVAFRWMEIEGPLYDDASNAGYRLLFGDLPLKKIVAAQPEGQTKAGRGRGGRGRGGVEDAALEVTSTDPKADAERLLRTFIARAYRTPVEEDDVQLFLKLFDQHFTELKFNFTDAMVAMYTAVLSSPTYVYVDEKPGPLDDHALATRLALFLWNSEPDAALRVRAAKGELHRPDVLRAETDRLLTDPKAQRFADAFLDYWLDLRKMLETSPDTALYNDYYLDDSLTEAATAETKLFFNELLRNDLPARNIVDSNFTFVNERLAAHYGVANIKGVAMRRFELAKDSPRGGFLTQASILKVTANGTTTSPVLRGKWVMEKIVGYEIPPPPAAVPAVDPDIRGAVTIRQQLDKHRADESCAMCHRKIDPAGLALESFDIYGGWRDRYRAVSTDKAPEFGFGKNCWPYVFHYALPVETDGELADGRAFKNIRDLKQLLLQDEAQIARNFVQQLTTYATGAPIRFSDRAKVEKILQSVKARQYGVRSILNEIVQSEMFLNK